MLLYISSKHSLSNLLSRLLQTPFLFYVILKTIGATIWCLEAHLVFGVFVKNFIIPTNTLDIDTSCPPSLQLPRSSQTKSTLIYMHTYIHIHAIRLPHTHISTFNIVLIWYLILTQQQNIITNILWWLLYAWSSKVMNFCDMVFTQGNLHG